MKQNNLRPLAAAACLIICPALGRAAPPALAPEQAAALFKVLTEARPPFADDAELIAAITPAVVSVFPARIVDEASGEAPLDRFFNRDRSAPDGNNSDSGSRDNERVQGVGSGVVLSADGWIVTNSHVVHFQNGKLADAISVEFPDRRRFDAEIAGADPLTDLALLKIKAADLTFLHLADSDSVRVGHPVYAVGNPFKLGITATKGMVSAVRRAGLGINGSNGFESFLQTDAAINPGNSGGVLADRFGRVAGINTAIWGGAGRGNVGIGFAIPSNLVRNVISQLAEKGKVERGFFGWQITEPNRQEIAAAGLATMAGARISEVMADSPAATAGLRTGDIILEAAAQSVISRGDLRFLASMVKPGETLALAYQRNGQRLTAVLTAGRPETRTSADPAAFHLEALPGVEFRSGPAGIAVAKIGPREATLTGLAEGTTITEINGTAVTDATNTEAALTKGVNRLKTRRAGNEQTLAIRLPLGAAPE
jgi:S1-C subfamily serine protease